MCFDESCMLPNLPESQMPMPHENKEATSLAYWYGVLSQLQFHDDSETIFKELNDLCKGKSPRYAQYLTLYLDLSIVEKFMMFPALSEHFRHAFEKLVTFENDLYSIELKQQ